jgi:hypothetical protein
MEDDMDNVSFANKVINRFGISKNPLEFNDKPGSDMTAFDWTCISQDMEFCAAVFDKLFGKGTIEAEIVRHWYGIGKHQCIWVLPNGDTWIQLFSGIQKSGCPLTLFLNSLLQCAFYAACGGDVKKFFCMGDDTKANEFPAELEDFLRARGKIVTLKEKDFCSRKMVNFGGKYVMQLQNAAKTIMGLHQNWGTAAWQSSLRSAAENFAADFALSKLIREVVNQSCKLENTVDLYKGAVSEEEWMELSTMGMIRRMDPTKKREMRAVEFTDELSFATVG